MKIDLTDTTASKINKALVQGRRAIGTPAVGMVLTLVIVTDEENAYDALKAANDASREHPSRTLVVVKRVSRSPRDRTTSRLDAEVQGRRGRGHAARRSSCGCTARSSSTPTRWSCPCCCRTPRWSSGGR